MRALSIRQPYAFAIVMGFKPVENRDWRSDYRGPLLIHAGLQEFTARIGDVLRQIAKQTKRSETELDRLYRAHSARGAIVGRATIVDCVTHHPSKWFYGPNAFVLEDPTACPPLAWRGQQQFFDVPDDVAATLRFHTRDSASADLFAAGKS